MPQSEVITYLQEVVKQKQNDEMIRNTDSGVSADGKVHMTETRIYIGLNDAITKEQKFDTEKYKGILKKICQNYHVAFSLDIEEGGFFHEDGEYTEETSLILIMIDPDPNIVKDIAKDLCTFFHQESVLVTEDQVTGYFISRESLLD